MKVGQAGPISKKTDSSTYWIIYLILIVVLLCSLKDFKEFGSLQMQPKAS
jgi:hypothetical protein